MTEFPKWDYQEYPKTLPRDDFWGQVRRTIMGRRISESEVALIVADIRSRLALRQSDVLLDVGCGNGALSARMFGDCAGYAGADLSPYLIEVAKEYFERLPGYSFFNLDAATFVETVELPGQFTKGLCFATLQYLAPATAENVLGVLWSRFPNMEHVLLGNLPDRERAERFFGKVYDAGQLDEHQSQIGRWWSRSEIEQLAASAGWTVSFSQMSESVFNASYRFSALLARSPA